MPSTSLEKIIIRNATRQEIDSIVQFQLAMAWETEQMKLDVQVVTDGVTAVMDDSKKGEYVLAVDGSNHSNGNESDRIVGSLLILPEWSDWRNAAVMWIHSVYVLPEARGLGIFKMMYQRLVEKVNQSDRWCGLRLYVDQSNHHAQRIYESLGMNAEHYKLYEWMPQS